MSLKVKKKLTPEMRAILRTLVRTRVFVGVPAKNADREPDEDGKPADLNNAEIGYLMETGIPEMNVPARPHLIPGIERIQGEIGHLMAKGLKGEFSGKNGSWKEALTMIGQKATSSVQGMIREGLQPPLPAKTVANRFRKRENKKRRKGEQQYVDIVAAGGTEAEAAAATGIKPLYDTGGYLRSITYVVGDKGKREKK